VVDEGEALPDGTYFGFLRGVDPQARTVSFDLMQHFIGPAAYQAQSEDGLTDHLDGYTRNPTDAVRSLPVAVDVVVTRVGCCVYEGAPGTFDGLAAAFLPSAKQVPDYGDLYRGPVAPYWLTIQAGVVIRIDEHYRS
jgi:hypothetical protein